MQQKSHTNQQGIGDVTFDTMSVLRQHAHLFKGKFSTIFNSLV